MNQVRLPWVATWAAILLASCGGRATGDFATGGTGGAAVGSERCTPNLQISCGCLGGTIGVQRCEGDGMSFGPCECTFGVGGSTAEGGTAGAEGSCVPNQQIGCACDGAMVGVSACDSDGLEYGPCECPESGGAGGTGGSAGSGGTGGSGGSGGTAGAGGQATHCDPVPDEVTLDEGDDGLVEVFAFDEGVIIVSATRVVVRDRAGGLLHDSPWPRDITSAAFDGTTLAIADMALLTKLNTSLEIVATTELTESCADSVIVSGGRFVCGADVDWDRTFYTYDLADMTLLASSSGYTYHGIPMALVPGKDEFVTVSTGSSPSDFYLYRVAANSKVQFVNESPYHGDFAVTTVFAFDGTPAHHLITQEGLLLQIVSDGLPPQKCFVKDGVLGTLHDGELFLALADDGNGTVFALTTASNSYYGSPCADGCNVQRIDVASRTVLSEKAHHVQFGETVVAHYDACTDRMVLGYTEPGTSPWEPGPWRVELLAD